MRNRVVEPSRPIGPWWQGLAGRLLLVPVLVLPVSGLQVAAEEPAEYDVRFQWAFVATESGLEPKLIDKDRSLKSGDALEIFLKPTSDCQVYLVHQDPSGKISSLYRTPNAADPEEEPLREPMHVAFLLDDTKGFETFFLLASREPLQDLELLLDRYTDADPAEKKIIATDVVAEIRRLNRVNRNLKRIAIRPVRIGGSMLRDLPTIRDLAQQISAESFVGKTITIDHQ